MNEPENNDEQIIRAVLNGRREEFAHLVRRHQEKVRSLCLSLMRNATEADDAAQEVFVKAFQALGRFQGRSRFSTWLYRVAYRHCLDLLRSRGRRRTDSLEVLLEERGEGAMPVAASSGGAALENREVLEKILSSLPPEYRLILTLREAQGLSYEELAAATGTTLDSVKARLRRARQALEEKARHFRALSGV
ncbi:MAG TPA: RNA polymerase sigma factor [Elusimicrobiota bacterium]|nr:RNA polymerase sigma factor [Elusimicrobiota bacterium]